MRLTKVRITNFQSIHDSNEFDVGDVTCLVGKNEAGKTALLKALYRLNPIVTSDGIFNPTYDYPRQFVSDYKDAIKSDDRDPDNVVQATYVLDPDDIAAITDIYGHGCLESDEPTIELCKGYSNETTYSGPDIDEKKALNHLIDTSELPDSVRDKLRDLTVQEKIEALGAVEQIDAVKKLTHSLQEINDRSISDIIYDILKGRFPKYLYFDEYHQLTGEENLDALRVRESSGSLKKSDLPLLGLISLASLTLDQMIEPGDTETLVARLEAAENRLTEKALHYWSQNRHLRMTFDVRSAQPNDPKDMQSGTNIWGRVKDTAHHVTTSLGTRSRGFIWFFSFLAWYSKTQKEEQNIILLLDEPGLSLHAKAQADLLRYFEKELVPHHQLIYTTHSPFMIDPNQFRRVRIVQDLSVDVKDPTKLSDRDRGTQVITDVLRVTSDSLFPLHGALGYEIHQTLFIGPNCLVVEGVSDLLYIQTMSNVLQERGQAGLRADWTITPVGGAGKVPTFIALLGANTKLNIAVLVDYHRKDKQAIEDLYKTKLIRKKKVLTYADFVDNGTGDVDIEDMFAPEFYLRLVNGAYGTDIDLNDLSTGQRIIPSIEKYLLISNKTSFNHYRPAFYLSNNVDDLADGLTEELNRFQRLFDALNRLLKRSADAN